MHIFVLIPSDFRVPDFSALVVFLNHAFMCYIQGRIWFHKAQSVDACIFLPIAVVVARNVGQQTVKKPLVLLSIFFPPACLSCLSCLLLKT